MTDSKISKKSHPAGNLAMRILTGAILLLVIPLFLQSFFLYRQEYQQKVEDLLTELTVLGKERAHWIKTKIETNWMLLDLAAASPGILNGKVAVEKIPSPPGVFDHFVLVSKSQKSLITGKRDRGGNVALVIPIPFSQIGQELGISLPVQISIIDQKGKVLWQNRAFTDKSELLEVKEALPDTDLSLRFSVDRGQIQGLHLEDYYFRFATLLFFVGGIGGAAVYLFTRRIGRPLKNLCKTMERVAAGAAHARYTPDWMGFEIDSLGIQFNETLDSLLHHIQEVERERVLREKLAEELRIGHEIQSNLLPSHVPGLPGLDIATGYFAAREVNGDFFDLFRLANGALLIAVCDTAGKGISACLYSLGLRSMIRALANEVTDLAELVRKVNDLYYLDAHESSMFSTLWLGIYHPTDHRLVYCTQGHPPALLRRGSELKELWSEGIALGAQKIDVIPTQEILLLEGDLLVLYTDGIIEAHDEDNQLFGKGRLKEFVLRKKGETAQQITDQLIEEIYLFGQGARQHDDMTLIIIRINSV